MHREQEAQRAAAFAPDQANAGKEGYQEQRRNEIAATYKGADPFKLLKDVVTMSKFHYGGDDPEAQMRRQEYDAMVNKTYETKIAGGSYDPASIQDKIAKLKFAGKRQRSTSSEKDPNWFRKVDAAVDGRLPGEKP